MRILVGVIGMTALSACATTQDPNAGVIQGGIDVPVVLGVAAYENYVDVPFDSGTVNVVATDGDYLRTYILTPCGENRICGPDGRAGQLQRTDEYFVVTGAYRDLTFFLSQGGDGYLSLRGENRDLAWN